MPTIPHEFPASSPTPDEPRRGAASLPPSTPNVVSGSGRSPSPRSISSEAPGSRRAGPRADAALHAWMATANAQRSRWTEMQSEREAAQAELSRKLRALRYGALAGGAAVLLVAVGFALAGTAGPSLPTDLAAVPAPPLEAFSGGITGTGRATPSVPPPPDIAVEGTIRQTWAKGEEYYGVEFDTRRLDEIEVRFLGPHGLWPDSDYRRWCSERVQNGVRHCRYERKLDREVQAGAIPPGAWVLKACMGDACEELTRYEIALRDEPLKKHAQQRVGPPDAQTAQVAAEAPAEDAPALPEAPAPAPAEISG
jgi:hypothetical protein